MKSALRESTAKLEPNVTLKRPHLAAKERKKLLSPRLMAAYKRFQAASKQTRLQYLAALSKIHLKSPRNTFNPPNCSGAQQALAPCYA
jgi:hypothetical protein